MINIVASTICTFLTYLYLDTFFLPKVTPFEVCFYNFVSRVFHFISIDLSISLCLFLLIFELYENGTVCIMSYVPSFFHFIVLFLRFIQAAVIFLLSLIYNIPVCSYYTMYLLIPLLMYIRVVSRSFALWLLLPWIYLYVSWWTNKKSFCRLGFTSPRQELRAHRIRECLHLWDNGK